MQVMQSMPTWNARSSILDVTFRYRDIKYIAHRTRFFKLSIFLFVRVIDYIYGIYRFLLIILYVTLYTSNSYKFIPMKYNQKYCIILLR